MTSDTHKPDAQEGPIVPSWVEIISADGRPLTYIIRGGQLPDRTTFLTPPEFKQQVGYVAYPAGGVIARHMHLPIHRHLIGTSEVLVVLKGHAWIDVYDDSHGLVASRELRAGDVMLMVGGGHGFRVIEDTVFLEIKQGPYQDQEEKERF
jgi:mannose-6-phosphate isomerase-like protein (cupin superfamily)